MYNIWCNLGLFDCVFEVGNKTNESVMRAMRAMDGWGELGSRNVKSKLGLFL